MAKAIGRKEPRGRACGPAAIFLLLIRRRPHLGFGGVETIKSLNKGRAASASLSPVETRLASSLCISRGTGGAPFCPLRLWATSAVSVGLSRRVREGLD